jgi:hypothetical protein
MTLDQALDKIESCLTKLSLGGGPEYAQEALEVLGQIKPTIMEVVKTASIQGFKEALIAINESVGAMYSKLEEVERNSNDNLSKTE